MYYFLDDYIFYSFEFIFVVLHDAFTMVNTVFILCGEQWETHLD